MLADWKEKEALRRIQDRARQGDYPPVVHIHDPMSLIRVWMKKRRLRTALIIFLIGLICYAAGILHCWLILKF